MTRIEGGARGDLRTLPSARTLIPNGIKNLAFGKNLDSFGIKNLAFGETLDFYQN